MKKTQLSSLFSPITIKGVTIRNRSAVSAMVTCSNGEDGNLTEAYMAYHEAKAKGGYGLLITENYMIAPNVGGFPNLPGLYKKEHVEQNKIFTERIHKHGAKILAQIYHSGRFMINGQPVSASDTPAGNQNCLARELTIEEIHEIQNQYANAAKMAKEAGFDGVEIHGAHIYLVAQFLSAIINKRADEYGGGTYNRARFAVEIVEKIRAAVGDDFIIGFRIGSQEYEQGGYSIEETKAFCRLLEAAGVDLFNCSGNGGAEQSEYGTAPAAVGKGRWLNNPEELKKAVSVPVIAVGARLADPFLANEALASGKCDMAVMSRASIADPEIINKAERGEYDNIRQCIGCNQGCLGEVGMWQPMRCLVNPLLGNESVYDLSVVAKPKKVLVVGGGIAGCEAAIVAATKGHKVTLIEKSDRLGGQWLVAAKPVGKTDFNTFVYWQSNELKRLNVVVKLNTAFTKEMLAENYDVIIVATGSHPVVPKVEGIDNPMVVTAEDILNAKVLPGKNILVIGGGQTGQETADLLVYRYGRKVKLVEMMPQLPPCASGEQAAESLMRKRWINRPIEIYTSTGLDKVTDKEVVLSGEHAAVLTDVDQIVLAVGVRKNTKVMDMLEDYAGKVLYVGDANGVKSGYKNVHEAYKTALEI